MIDNIVQIDPIWLSDIKYVKEENNKDFLNFVEENIFFLINVKKKI